MIRRPPRSTPLYSPAASDLHKRQDLDLEALAEVLEDLDLESLLDLSFGLITSLLGLDFSVEEVFCFDVDFDAAAGAFVDAEDFLDGAAAAVEAGAVDFIDLALVPFAPLLVLEEAPDGLAALSCGALTAIFREGMVSSFLFFYSRIY